MKTKEEIRDWLLENAVDDYGDLYLPNLDFSNFDGDVVISGMKVKSNVIISRMKVQGDLYQSDYKVEGDYTCEDVKVGGEIFFEKPIKILKPITTEELAELGYKLKGE